MCEAFIPLLKLSDSPRIVNVSSFMGQLKVRTKNIQECLRYVGRETLFLHYYVWLMFNIEYI